MSRDRIADLEHRYRRFAVKLTAAVALAVIGAGLAFLRVGDALNATDRQQGQLADVVVEIQASRARALEDACRRTNAQNMGIVAFVQKVAPDVAPEARRAFPLEPDCPAYARRQSGGPARVGS